MRSTRLLFFTLGLLTPGVLFGQDPDSVRVDSTRVARQYDLPGLTISVPRPALTTGGSSAVAVRLDSLGSVPAPSMEEVLRAMPLLIIRQNSRGEAQPSLRGSGDRQIGVFMDGVPLTIGWDHRTDMSIIPLTAAQSVRLVRGLSSVLYGPNTLGGVVEVDVARVPGRTESVTPLTLGFSTDDVGGRTFSAGVARLFDSEDQIVVRAGVGFQDRPGFPLPDGAARDPDILARFLTDGDALRLNSDSRRVDGYVAARYRAEGGAWVSMATTAYDVERGVPPEAHEATPRLWRYPNQQRLLTALSLGTGSRNTGRGSGDVDFSLGIDLGSTRIDQYDSERFQSVVGREDSDDRTLTFRLEGEHSAGSAGDLRAAATYADVRHDEVLTPGVGNGFRQRLWSFAVESEWRMGSNGQTRVALGAVADGGDTPESGDKPPVARLSDYGLRVGVSSLATQSLLLHGSVSRRARFPSLRELYSGALGRFEANPSLRPERLIGAEAGMTLHTGSLEVQVVGFHQRLEDGIIRSTVTVQDGGRRFKRINQDEIRSSGAELLAVGTIGPGTLSADLTLQQVRGYEEDGSQVELEYEPAWSGKVRIERPIGRGVRASTDVRFLGQQSCQNAETGQLAPLASSATLDVGLRRVFQLHGGRALSRVDASASLRNVADDLVYDQCGLPQPGRSFQIQFRLW